jgi:ABC-2 type transport system permease protein
MLTKNEIIKLALRGSTQILAVLLIIMSAGLCLIFWVDNNYNYGWYGDWDYTEDYSWSIRHLEQEILELETRQPPNWEIQVEHFRTEIEYYRFLTEHRISWRDWREFYVREIFYSDAIDKEAAKKLLGSNDWEAFYKLIISERSSALKMMGVSDEMIELENFKYIYSLEHDVSPIDDTWKNQVLNLLTQSKQQIYALEQQNSDKPDNINQLNKLKDEAAILEYRLENNVERVVSYGGMMNIGGFGYITPETDVWTMLEACVMMIPFMSVFIIIIAGGLVSIEFSRGTIKFLLITPVKRWKILMSKYVVMLLTGMAFLAAMFTVFFLLGGILTGFSNMDAVNLVANNAKVTAVPALVYYGQLYLLGACNIAIIATLAFALSSVSRNSALAIAVSIAVLIGGSIIDMMLRFAAGVDWGRYLLFANIDLIGIIYGASGMYMPYKGHTLGFALGVIAVHMVIFILMAWDGFTKKEI